MLDGLRGARLLDGVRGRPAVDRGARRRHRRRRRPARDRAPGHRRDRPEPASSPGPGGAIAVDALVVVARDRRAARPARADRLGRPPDAQPARQAERDQRPSCGTSCRRRSPRPTADERVRVIAIAGAGRAFCSGYDLSEEQPDSALGLARRARPGRGRDARDPPLPQAGHRPGPRLCAGGRPRAGDGLRPDRCRGGHAARRAGDPVRVGAGDAADAVRHRPEADPRAAADRRPHRRRGGGADRARQPRRAGAIASRPRSTRSPTASPASSPDVMAPTKLMLNRAMDAAGFAAAVEMGLDLQSFINMSADVARVRRDRPARRPQGRAGVARRPLRRAAAGCRQGRRRRRRPRTERRRAARPRTPPVHAVDTPDPAPDLSATTATGPDRTGPTYRRRWSRRPVSPSSKKAFDGV